MTHPSPTLPYRQMIPVDRLHPGENNPREDPGDLSGLEESIRKQGLQQPLLVRPKPGSDDHWDIKDGWRRYLAMKDWNTEIPSIIIPPRPGENKPVQDIYTALVTDAHRKDLNQIERARAFKRLQDEFGFSASEIAKQVGLSVSTVTTSMMLMQLAPKAQQMIIDKQLSAADAQELLKQYRAKQRKKQGHKQPGAQWEPDWFTAKHPLAALASALCERRGHNMRRRIGAKGEFRGACGQCWESEIRRDQDLVNDEG